MNSKRDIKKYLSLIIVLLSMMLPDVAMAQNRYRVGVCDWMVLKRQKLGEFKLAKELGGEIKAVSFVRFEKGEGLEKREDNFADEVASMMK